jgi:hypothetical protein
LIVERLRSDPLTVAEDRHGEAIDVREVRIAGVAAEINNLGALGRGRIEAMRAGRDLNRVLV